MSKSYAESYREAGVDIEAGYEEVQRIKKHIARTTIPGVLSEIGDFGGLFAPAVAGMENPVLVSGTDGVGTKVRLAQLLNKHDTIGIDAVAMCVNDILCSGAKPLFFLDYISTGKNDPAKMEAIVSGIADGCVQAGCALIGGETAEHPGLMEEDEYDVAGFAVGIADRKDLLKKENVKEGDAVLALPSSGVHANGFSLVRKLFDVEHADLNETVEELGMPLGEALLTPTRIYVRPVLAVLEKYAVHGISHITGGGFFENIPRCLPDGLGADIASDKVKRLPVFDYIQKKGGLSDPEMFNTFNMGVGMILVVEEKDAEGVLSVLREQGENACRIGEIRAGLPERVVLR